MQRREGGGEINLYESKKPKQVKMTQFVRSLLLNYTLVFPTLFFAVVVVVVVVVVFFGGGNPRAPPPPSSVSTPGHMYTALEKK